MDLMRGSQSQLRNRPFGGFITCEPTHMPHFSSKRIRDKRLPLVSLKRVLLTRCQCRAVEKMHTQSVAVQQFLEGGVGADGGEVAIFGGFFSEPGREGQGLSQQGERFFPFPLEAV